MNDKEKMNKKHKFQKKILDSYEYIGAEYLDEYSCFCYKLKHKKTGLKVFRFITNDTEMFFSFGFPTPPVNDKGITHIIEHTILAGSKSYDIPNPFEECASRLSLSYINAETHPDVTIYPVASTVVKDFTSAFRMYADAVFNPMMRKEQFRQEGIRYVLDGDGKLLEFNGVVYNEMRGDLAGRDARIYMSERYFLSKENERFESGGDPCVIPFLTYEEYINYYKKYYHPENCILVLYGDDKCDDLLDILNNDILEKPYAAEYLEVNESNPIKVPSEDEMDFTRDIGMEIKQKDDQCYLFSVHNSDSSQEPFFQMIFDTGVYKSDVIRYRELSVLVDALLGTAQSPLYKAITRSKIAKDIGDETGLEIHNGKVYFNISLDGILITGEQDVIIKTCEEKIRKILSKIKFDKTLHRYIASAIKSLKVEVSERGSTPLGKIFSTRIMTSPCLDLSLCQPFKSLNEIDEMYRKDKNIFKDLFDDIFLSKSAIWHKIFLVYDDKYTNTADEYQKKLLDFFDKKLNKKAIKDEYENSYQEKKKRNENKIDPKMLFKGESIQKIAEMIKYPNIFSTSVSGYPKTDTIKMISGLTLDNYKKKDSILIYTGDVVSQLSYFNLAFSISGLNENEIRYLKIMNDVLMRSQVNGISDFYEKFTDAMISFDISILTLPSILTNNDESPYIALKFEILNDDVEEGLFLLSRMLIDSIITKENIKDSILSLQTEYSDISRYAYTFSKELVSAAFDSNKLFDSVSKGAIFKGFIDNLNVEDDLILDEVYRVICDIYKKIFTRQNLFFSVFSNSFPDVAVYRFVESLPSVKNISSSKKGKIINATSLAELLQSKQIKIGRFGGGAFYHMDAPFNVSYLSAWVSCQKFSSSLNIMTNYIQDKPLFEAIRAEGGAYGAIMDYNYYFGNLIISSIRDPNGIKSFKKFFQSLYVNVTNQVVQDAKHSVLSPLSFPVSNKVKAFKYFARFLMDITNQERKIRIEQIKRTTLKDCKDALEELIEKNVLTEGGKAYSLIGTGYALNELAVRYSEFLDSFNLVPNKKADQNTWLYNYEDRERVEQEENIELARKMKEKMIKTLSKEKTKQVLKNTVKVASEKDGTKDANSIGSDIGEGVDSNIDSDSDKDNN